MVFTYKSERKLLNWLGFFCFVLFFRTKEIVVEGETLWGEGRFEMCFEEAEINSLLRAQHRMPWWRPSPNLRGPTTRNSEAKLINDCFSDGVLWSKPTFLPANGSTNSKAPTTPLPHIPAAPPASPAAALHPGAPCSAATGSLITAAARLPAPGGPGASQRERRCGGSACFAFSSKLNDPLLIPWRVLLWPTSSQMWALTSSPWDQAQPLFSRWVTALKGPPLSGQEPVSVWGPQQADQALACSDCRRAWWLGEAGISPSPNVPVLAAFVSCLRVCLNKGRKPPEDTLVTEL